jgi:creatinine amidohydrolase/Fe(II)-dependent formamide hydrolase-like protein/N-acetylglutamate synthase-like GNAT family acetyltransferase
MLAEDLNAALLPAMHFATSLEHTGFRGAVSLRPETAMQVIRDVADEVERQNFRILIVVNSHGGNFFLIPVIRDMNRLDRPLKILLVHPWDFAHAKPAGPSAGAVGHAAEDETSVMMAIAPDLVHLEQAQDSPPRADEPVPLMQRDLTTFGIGHFSAAGVTGYPSRATAEKGRAIVESIRKGMLPVVRDRIARLREQPRYAGAGGIAVRAMTEADVPGVMHLKTLAGWNQTPADWRMFLAAAPKGCVVAVHNGRVVGSATLVSYADQLGWIGMVLVDPAFRRLGIATRLMKHAMDTHAQCRTIKLDATPEGRKVYLSLGFVDEYGLRRLVTSSLPAVPAAGDQVAPLEEADLPAAIALDREVFGADRTAVLSTLFHNSLACAFQLTRSGQFRGLCLGRPGTNFFQVGPILADTAEDAIALAKAALHPLAGRPVLIDASDAAPAAFADWLTGLGFTLQRSFTRMYRGTNDSPGQPVRQFAVAGPEIG